MTKEEVRQIVDLMVARLDKRLAEQQMTIELTDAAKDLLAERGFDPVLGARPLRRAIQRDIEDALSEKMYPLVALLAQLCVQYGVSVPIPDRLIPAPKARGTVATALRTILALEPHPTELLAEAAQQAEAANKL